MPFFALKLTALAADACAAEATVAANGMSSSSVEAVFPASVAFMPLANAARFKDLSALWPLFLPWPAPRLAPFSVEAGAAERTVAASGRSSLSDEAFLPLFSF